MGDVIKQITPLTEATYYILLSLKKENHGYGIIKNVESLTEGRLLLAPGTLYGVLQNLLKQHCINVTSIDVTNKKKKEYIITELGNKVLLYETRRLKQMLDHSKLMGVDIND